MGNPQLSSSRLDMKPLPAAAAAALPDGRETAAEVLGATLPPMWPQSDLLDVLPMQAAAAPDLERFGVWVMIERQTTVVVGDVGFMGPPEDGLVEIGFSVIPDRRRRGYATEAARALVDWALGEPGIRGVIARCDASNEASIRVLERAGLRRTGEADRQIRWRSEISGES
jgi:[ribosomal protein S5]-alanine N-acetyltransferase